MIIPARKGLKELKIKIFKIRQIYFVEHSCILQKIKFYRKNNYKFRPLIAYNVAQKFNIFFKRPKNLRLIKH